MECMIYMKYIEMIVRLSTDRDDIDLSNGISMMSKMYDIQNATSPVKAEIVSITDETVE